MSIRLYLDIDGCLNATPYVSKPRGLKPPHGPWDDYTAAWYHARDGRDLPIIWSPALMLRLAHLSDLPDVDVLFATSWESESRDFAALVDLPAWNWLALPLRPDGTHGPVDEWKGNAIDTDLSKHPADTFIWVDDDFWKSGSVTLAGTPGTRLRPTAEVGITPKNLARIEELIGVG